MPIEELTTGTVKKKVVNTVNSQPKAATVSDAKDASDKGGEENERKNDGSRSHSIFTEAETSRSGTESESESQNIQVTIEEKKDFVHGSAASKTAPKDSCGAADLDFVPGGGAGLINGTQSAVKQSIDPLNTTSVEYAVTAKPT
jgi:hypothetical protein